MPDKSQDILETEIVNPIISLIREYEAFEKEELLKYEMYKRTKKMKTGSKKMSKLLFFYALIFVGVSAFKMNALYEIVDLKMELKSLNSKIFESESLINSLKYSDKPYINITDIEKESKKLGFTEEKNIEYIHFNDNR